MTYVKDEMLNLAARMTDMSEDLISESDIRSGATPLLKPRRTGRFSAFVNHPAMVAVLCAVVSLGVVVAIVLAGRGEFTAPFWGTQEVNSQENEELITQNEIEDALFSLGMTYEEVIDVLESREISYTYCLQRFFIPKGNGSFLVLMMDPWGPFVIDHIEEYQEKQPATKDIYSIQ